MFFFYQKYSSSKFATVLSFIGGACYAGAILIAIYALTGDIEFEIGVVVGIIACVVAGLVFNFLAKSLANSKTQKLLAKQNSAPVQPTQAVQPVQPIMEEEPVSFDIHTGQPIYKNVPEETKEESKEIPTEEKEKEFEKIEEELGKTIIFVSFPTEEEKKEQNKKTN